MITSISTIEENKEAFFDLLLNHTDKVTKVSPDSVLNGIGYGIGKLGQKTQKDVALVEAHLYPDTAYGPYLDACAERKGVAPRFGASGSSTYVRVVGIPGTQYVAGTHVFSSSSGVNFAVAQNFTIGNDGFGYLLINSITSGNISNVPPLTINSVAPIPTGHTYCINENQANGGRDIEDDDTFRRRIKEGSNFLAKGTLSMLTQVFMLINNDVLRLYYRGRSTEGKQIIEVLAQNGVDFSDQDFEDIMSKSEAFFSLDELNPYNTSGGFNVELRNISWQPIDISARVSLITSVNPNDVRREIQIRLNKYIDYRYWTKTQVQWVDLFNIVKNTPGVAFASDTGFSPNVDFGIDRDKQPRMRGFLLLDLNGNIISNASGTLNPTYYPNQPDFSYQQSIYASLIS